MSYINMDHAGWVERNILASKRQMPNKQQRQAAVDHKGWYGAPDKLSPFQARVMNILGIVGNGIYNAPIAWDNVEWGHTDWQFVLVPWGRTLSTFDFSELTRLVFFCHDARIRCEIEPLTFRRLKLGFWPRIAVGGNAKRHPNLDEAVAEYRMLIDGGHHTAFPTWHQP